MEFKDKIVLITGSTRGIGKATALMFAKEGAKVVINYSKSDKEAEETFNQVKKISGGLLIKCDVSDERQVKNMINQIIKKFGRLDILVNNVGRYIEGDEWNGSSDIWLETLKIDLISVMIVSKYATEVFLKQKSGIIVNISSRYSFSGRFDSLAYSASKAAIVNVTQAYAKLLSPFGRANSISPGAVRAGYWLRAPKDELESQIASSYRKKLIEPEEVAEKVLFLASKESDNTNGQNILLDFENKS